MWIITLKFGASQNIHEIGAFTTPRGMDVEDLPKRKEIMTDLGWEDDENTDSYTFSHPNMTIMFRESPFTNSSGDSLLRFAKRIQEGERQTESVLKPRLRRIIISRMSTQGVHVSFP